ncbi:DUF2238 domain-containing protein [Serratia sp. CY56810]|uniref:DUF2238 domain-containing protein n=1 Tax=Serratia TaxID=613 RepID=UPI003D80A539
MTAKRYPQPPILYYSLIFIGYISLIVGGMYSYTKVPLGFEVQEWFNLSHLFQGLVPVLAAQKVLIRSSYINGRKMLVFLV